MKPSLIAHTGNSSDKKQEPFSRTDQLFSHHIFLLPFKWSKSSAEEVDSLPTTDDLEEMTTRLTREDWENHPFQLDTVANYNEWHYFYDYVRKVIYETSNLPKDKRTRFIRHFRHKYAEGGTYEITTPCPPNRKTKDGKETYRLFIDEIYLHLYDTGVGVLSFHLDNRDGEKSTPEDVLLINQYGRRVFPPFYLINPERVGTQEAFDLTFADEEENELQPHGMEVAHSVCVTFERDGGRESYPENWGHLRKQLRKNVQTVRDLKASSSAHESLIPAFSPARFCHPFLKEFYELEKEKEGKDGSPNKEIYRLQSVLDDRMFTVCWFGSDEKANDFGPTWGNDRDPARKDKFLSYDWWYQYVFVDGNTKTVDDPELQRKLIQEASYRRWSQRGTWYGITDYSFVMLTSSLPTLKRFDAEFLVTHLQSIYYKLVELTLVQRATVQRFSNEVTFISQLDIPAEVNNERFKTEVKRLADNANDLYRRYIRFVNGLYFREVTAQVQGLELYRKLQDQSRLPLLVSSLKEEIHELHNYVRQETDRRLLKEQEDLKQEQEDLKLFEEKRLNFLTRIGALFLAPTLLVATYDLGFYGDCLKAQPNVFYFLTFTAAVVTALLFSWAFEVKSPQADQPTKDRLIAQDALRKKRLPRAIITYLILLLLPMGYGCFYCPAPPAPTVVTGEVSITPAVTNETTVQSNISQPSQQVPVDSTASDSVSIPKPTLRN